MANSTSPSKLINLLFFTCYLFNFILNSDLINKVSRRLGSELICNYFFEIRFCSVRRKIYALKKAFARTGFYFFSNPGRHSFVVLPRAIDIQPLQGNKFLFGNLSTKMYTQ